MHHLLLNPSCCLRRSRAWGSGRPRLSLHRDYRRQRCRPHARFAHCFHDMYITALPHYYQPSRCCPYFAFSKNLGDLFPHKTQLISFKAPPSMIYFSNHPHPDTHLASDYTDKSCAEPCYQHGDAAGGKCDGQGKCVCSKPTGSRLYPTTRDF